MWTVLLQALSGGLLFLIHGRHELDVRKNIAAFNKMGYPTIVGIYQSFSEGIASVLLALDIYPRIMAAFIAISMLGALRYHHKRRDVARAYEPAALYLIVMVVIILQGW